MAISPRDRRLVKDEQSVYELARQSSLIEVVPVNSVPGRPPEIWEVTFRCRGIVGINSDNSPVYDDHHRVRIELGREYPTKIPAFRWLTPVWHPNINHEPPHQVCINDWHPGRTLDDTILMLGRMVQYKNYHAERSKPFPLDETVARWVRWAETQGIVGKRKPVDDRELLRPRTRVTFRSSPSAAPSAPPSAVSSGGRLKIIRSGS